MKIILLILLILVSVSINAQSSFKLSSMKEEYATLGGGCFWCTEAIFEELEGILEVISGYSGGSVINPAYQEVTTGRTGHAEVVQIRFKPDIISYSEILDVFFKTHDPTTVNRQGADTGTQYRSVIFYHSETQRKEAEEKIKSLSNSVLYNSPIVTSVEKLENFYVAEDYHQDYFRKNPGQGYCTFVIAPKLKKLKKDFSSKLKEIK